MTTEDIAAYVPLLDQLVHQKTGQSLTSLQRLLLIECWKTSKKTYEAIAAENNYSTSYIQQRIAPALWNLLSEIVDTKVTSQTVEAF